MVEVLSWYGAAYQSVVLVIMSKLMELWTKKSTISFRSTMKLHLKRTWQTMDSQMDSQCIKSTPGWKTTQWNIISVFTCLREKELCCLSRVGWSGREGFTMMEFGCFLTIPPKYHPGDSEHTASASSSCHLPNWPVVTNVYKQGFQTGRWDWWGYKNQNTLWINKEIIGNYEQLTTLLSFSIQVSGDPGLVVGIMVHIFT